jgi:hypothetical protein
LAAAVVLMQMEEHHHLEVIVQLQADLLGQKVVQVALVELVRVEI